MNDFQFKIFTILLAFILLIICIICYYYTKWLDNKHKNKGKREISIADLFGVFFCKFSLFNADVFYNNHGIRCDLH